MAIDLKKDVSLGSLGKGKRGNNAYPTKKTMNLYVAEVGETNHKRTAIVGVGLAVVVALFSYFGVATPLMQVAAKRAELSQEQAKLAPIAEQVKDYDSVLAEYEKYARVSNSSGVDSLTVLDIVEQRVMPLSTVGQVDLKGTLLTLKLANVPLDTVGSIAQTLSGQPGVTSVSVSTAQSQQGEGSASVISTITVELQGSGDASSKGGK